MSHKNILTEKSLINQFSFELGFFLYFCRPVLKHIEQFIKRIIENSSADTPIFAIYDDILNPRQRLKLQFKKQVFIILI